MSDFKMSDAWINTVKKMGSKELKEFADTADWKKIMAALSKAMTKSGPSYGNYRAFDDLRSHLAGKKFVGKSEAETIYEGIKAPKTGPRGGSGANRAAVLALAKHTHMIHRAGAQDIWVLDLPTSYTEWPLDALASGDPTTRLNDTNVRFTTEMKKNLSSATQNAVAWVLKAMIVAGNPKDEANAAMISRWFCFGPDADKQVKKSASKLNAGLKKVLKILKSGTLILTDSVSERGTTENDGTEAFVFSGKGRDKFNVVYIEEAFFNTDQMLSGLPHWTRILIHELTHREINTDDVYYAHGGIGPSAGFPHEDAIRNADSWAWFCADINGALSDGVRTRALTTH